MTELRRATAALRAATVLRDVYHLTPEETLLMALTLFEIPVPTDNSAHHEARAWTEHGRSLQVADPRKKGG